MPTSYYLDDKQLYKKTTVQGVPDMAVLTAKEVLFERMDFHLADAGGLVPRILFASRGEVLQKGRVLSSFNIQTTVAHRTI